MNRISLIFSLFLIPVAFSLYFDLTKSYTVPKIIEPNKDFTYFLYLVNNEGTPVYDVKVKFYPPECLKLSKDEYDIDTLYNIYVIPLKVENNCGEGTYWIDAKIEYYNNKGYQEIKETIPIIVTSVPNILIKKVESKNAYPGKIANITVYLDKRNVYDLRVYINSTCVYPKTSYIYVGDSNSFWFEVHVPYRTYGICPIVLTFVYQDWQENQYKDVKAISIKINKLLGDVELYNYTVKNDNLIIKIKNNWNTKIYNVHLVLSSRDILFKKSEAYIKELQPYQIYELRFPFIKDKEGRFLVTINMFYTDENGNLYNKTLVIPVEIFSKPDVLVKLQKVEGNDIRLIVINSANSDVKSLYLELLPGDYKIIGSRIIYIGDLEANDYDTAEFKIIPLNKTVILKLKVYFKDALGKVHVLSKNITVTFPEEKKNTSIYYALLVIVPVIIYFVFKKRKREEE